MSATRYALVLPSGQISSVVMGDSSAAPSTPGMPGMWVQVPAGTTVPAGTVYENGLFHPPVQVLNVAPAPVYEWYIDVGAFFDRFGSAKYPVLMSTDPQAQAMVKDIQTRGWVDLKNQQVMTGVNYLATLNITGMTSALATTILSTQPTAAEQVMLRATYFKA